MNGLLRCVRCRTPRRPDQLRRLMCRGRCYRAWVNAGRPADAAPPRYAIAAARRAEYARLRGKGYTPVQAIRRLGLTYHSRFHFEARYRQQEQEIAA